MNIFWIHGGPGFNSNPEKNIINEKYKSKGASVFFWQHPSKMRGDDACYNWDSYISDLESKFKEFIETHKKVTIVAHSHGAFCSLYLIKKYEKHINKIIWSAGSVSMYSTLKNIYSFVGNDYEKQNLNEEALKCKSISNDSNVTMNTMLENANLLLGNQNYFTYYWSNLELMSQYLEFMQDDWSIDLESFTGTVSTQPEDILDMETKIETTLIYSSGEQVILNDIELEYAKKIFKNYKLEYFATNGHFPHLECQEKFLELVLD
jgi:pimeloyl-ACP methyl ester carboxylesterase